MCDHQKLSLRASPRREASTLGVQTGVAIRRSAHPKGNCFASLHGVASRSPNAFLSKHHSNGWCFNCSPLDASMPCGSPLTDAICHRHTAPNLDAPTSARDRRSFLVFLPPAYKKTPPKWVVFWQGQKGSNSRHAVLETAALPTELYPYKTACAVIVNGGPSGTRTRDRTVMSRLL